MTDTIQSLIDRLNASGWRVSIHQSSALDKWWVSVMRGEMYYSSMFRPTAVDALDEAIRLVAA